MSLHTSDGLLVGCLEKPKSYLIAYEFNGKIAIIKQRPMNLLRIFFALEKWKFVKNKIFECVGIWRECMGKSFLGVLNIAEMTS